MDYSTCTMKCNMARVRTITKNASTYFSDDVPYVPTLIEITVSKERLSVSSGLKSQAEMNFEIRFLGNSS